MEIRDETTRLRRRVALVFWMVVLGLAPVCWSQQYQRQVGVSWDFAKASDPLGWAPGSVMNGALTFTATAQSYRIFRPSITTPVAAMQRVEVVMSSNSAGAAQMCWARAQTSTYVVFQPGDENDFSLVGDGAFHHYYLPVNTPAVTTMYQLKLVLPPGATVSIQSVAVANLVEPSGAGVSPLWQFTSDGDASGWIPYEGVFDMTVSGGRLRVQAFTNATILAPKTAVTSQMEWFSLWGSVTQTSLESPWIMFNYLSSARNGASTSVYVFVSPDPADHVYNRNVGGAYWWGAVSQLSITVSEKTTVAISQVQVSASPQGSADPVLEACGSSTPLVRAGSQFQVSCRLSNRGAQPVQRVSLSLNLPSDGSVTLVSSPSGPASVESGYPQTLVWTLMANRSGSAAISVSATAQAGGSAQSAATILVLPPVTAQSSPYVPLPKPVSSSYDVGVYYWPLWHSDSAWDPIRAFPERMPVLGHYVEGEPQVADWQIKWAVEHGVKFFAVGGDWSAEGTSKLSKGEQPKSFLDAYLSSAYRGYVQFCITGFGGTSVPGLLTATQVWIDKYATRPEYYTIDQKPVLMVIGPGVLHSYLGNSTKDALDAARQLARSAGLKGIYFVATTGSDGATVAQMLADGYDALSGYNYPSAGTSDPDESPYSLAVSAMGGVWDGYTAASTVPYIIPTSPGFDNRPWAIYSVSPGLLVRTGSTADLFRQMLQMAKDRVDSGRNPRVVLVEAWEEIGEGSHVEPAAGRGFSYLDAIRSVFVDDSPHIDLGPSDVGLPLVQTSPSPALWTFTDPADLEPWLYAGYPGSDWVANVTGSRVANNQWTFTSNGTASLERTSFEVSAQLYSGVAIRMSVSADATVSVYWGAADELGPSAVRQTSFTAKAGPMQSYTLTLTGKPGWRGIINLLRLDIGGSTNVNVAIESIRFIPVSTAASIAVSKTQMRFTLVNGATSPALQTISVASATGSSLSWTATANAPWLALSPSNGTAPGNVAVSANPAGLAVGVYNAAITLAAAGAGNSPLTIPVTLWVMPTLPSVADGGVLNAASFSVGQAVAPGSLVSIFGTNLASSTASADSIPLPTSLANVSVQFNGIPAPLLFVSHSAANGDQINAQLPYEVPVGAAQMVVNNAGATSTSVNVPVTAAAPGIFALNSGSGQAIAFGNSDGALAAPVGSVPGLTTHPAKIGDPTTLVIFATGLGAVNPPMVTGNNVTDGQAHRTVVTPTVLVGGVQAQVAFSGMSPQFVGVNQINIVIQPGTPTGNSIPLQLVMNGITTTNKVTIAVTQ